MTQPAKVQEPSMEEILASIRRIIADDEAKPAAAGRSRQAAGKPRRAAAPKPVDEGHSAVGNSCAAPSRPPSRRRPSRRRRPPAVVSNSQDDIDAMLASLEEATPEAEIRPPQPDGDVFELTDEMALPDPRRAAVVASTRSSRRTISNSPKPPAPGPCTGSRPMSRRRSKLRRRPADPVALDRESAVESAFNSLANTVLSNNARTLEDLVKEMLRPMLKSWLDDNLPGLVERIVKAEIERVSRGR